MCDDSDSDEGEMPAPLSNGVQNGPGQLEEEDGDAGEEMFIDSLAPATDLFSAKTFRTAEDCVEHCKEVHGLDLAVLKKRHTMDTFSYIRFVNYVRAERPSPGFVMSLSSGEAWADTKYMKPVLQDDPLLMFNFEDEMESLCEEEEEENGLEIDISRELNDEIANPKNVFNSIDVIKEDNFVKIALDKFNELKVQYEAMRSEVKEKEAKLRFAMTEMSKMRGVAAVLMDSSSGSSNTQSESSQQQRDESYFRGYAHYGIHHEMLSDEVRTSSYRAALTRNPARLTGANVLDIGCGTGVLSMFAAQAGAGRVVGVDCSDIIYQAMDIVRENRLEDRVELVRGRLEEVELPLQQYDLIVSEWMGYFLLYEGMLDSVLQARDRYLAPGGSLLPNRVNIQLAAVSDPDRYHAYVGNFWSDVYGLQMSCMRAPILAEASVELVPAVAIVSEPVEVLLLDLNTCTAKDTIFSQEFMLTIDRDCELTGICGFFDTFFDLSEEAVMFSTGPGSQPTHWKQTVFYFHSLLGVTAGQTLDCKIICKRFKNDSRSLKLSLTVADRSYNYVMD